MPIITSKDVELIDRGDGGVFPHPTEPDQVLNPFQMDRYVIEAQIQGSQLIRLLPNQSRVKWDEQDEQFIEQLKTLFISQYIAGEAIVVEQS